MRFVGLVLLAFVLVQSASGKPRPVPQATPAMMLSPGPLGIAPNEGAPPPAALSPNEIEAEIARLRSALQQEVPHLAPSSPERDVEWVRLAEAASANGDLLIDRAELLVVVDRNPRVQELCIIVARPDAPWLVIGGVKVSTGQGGRRDHFITPVGVFLHTDAVLDFRAEGTFNENHIRGLGLKGMRVWDFGWQQATKGWRSDHQQGEMRLLMHATDPDRLERRLGLPASEGCVRVPAAMNRFLDHHGILDADYERVAEEDRRFGDLLPPDRVPTGLAGDALIVVDSSGAT